MFLEFFKDANITMMIMKAIEFFNIWFSEANIKNYECPFKLQFPSPMS